MRPRSLRRSLPLLVVAGALAGPFAAPVAAAGTTITVTSVGDAAAVDGLCTLREAITAANTNAASGGGAPGECPAGGASDTIVFAQVGQTVTVAAPLPAITANLTIDGGGAAVIDLAGHGHLAKDGGALILKRLTITHGGNRGVDNALAGSLQVIDSRITATIAGSGINNSGSLTVLRSTLSGNHFDGLSGGGLYNNATATVTDSVIDGNVALYGGGIYNGGTLTVTRTTLSNNNAGGGSGGGLYNNATATVTASTFSANASDAGGGIFNALNLVLANATLADNTGPMTGAAIYNNGTLAATNVTISRNVAGIGAGGLYNANVAVLKNTIVSGNVGSTLGGELAGNAPAAGSGHNLLGSPAGGVLLSALLDDAGLQANGGRTGTIRLVNSLSNPLRNGGSASVCAAAPVSGRDQRGVVRPSTSCSIGAVQLERTAPTAGTPSAGFLTGGTLNGSATAGRVTWSGADTSGGSGIDHYVLSRSVNGGAWTTIASHLPTNHGDTPMTSGKSYRFRVRAVDNDGNASGWAYGITVRPAIRQQTSASIHYGKTWSTQSGSFFSGGSVRWATSAGASASVTATGRAYAFVTTTDLLRGKAKVYVNGVLKATIDLRSDAIGYRHQAWSIRYGTSASRTIKVVVLGTSGRPRVDLDAFLVLR